MDAGRLRDRITIERRTLASQSATSGDPTFTWSAFAQRWAQVVPVEAGSGEPVENSRALSRRRYRVFIRHGSTFTAKDRVIWQNKTLNIDSIVEDREKDLGIWLITATEQAA